MDSCHSYDGEFWNSGVINEGRLVIMCKYAYVRVSSLEQNEDRQLIEVRKIGIKDENIFIDKQSGKDFDRPMYRRLINQLRENDVLYVLSIDRLSLAELTGTEIWCGDERACAGFVLAHKYPASLLRAIRARSCQQVLTNFSSSS